MDINTINFIGNTRENILTKIEKRTLSRLDFDDIITDLRAIYDILKNEKMDVQEIENHINFIATCASAYLSGKYSLKEYITTFFTDVFALINQKYNQDFPKN